jgi:hypothetical protein
VIAGDAGRISGELEALGFPVEIVDPAEFEA